MIRPEETEIVGRWLNKDGTVVDDEACERVIRLADIYLEKLGYSRGGGRWETLFRDPSDRRLWERWYPQSHMHGGGPPSLKLLSEREAREKYPDVFSESE